MIRQSANSCLHPSVPDSPAVSFPSPSQNIFSLGFWCWQSGLGTCALCLTRLLLAHPYTAPIVFFFPRAYKTSLCFIPFCFRLGLPALLEFVPRCRFPIQPPKNLFRPCCVPPKNLGRPNATSLPLSLTFPPSIFGPDIFLSLVIEVFFRDGCL